MTRRAAVSQLTAAQRRDLAAKLSRMVPGAADQLVAFVETKAATSSVHHLDDALRDTLPAHMVPSAIVPVERLPRLPNGKLDRTALAIQSVGSLPVKPIDGDGDGSIRSRLLEIWSAVLGQAEVPGDASFFELGGNSLLALRVGVRANAAGLTLPDNWLFDFPTIDALVPNVGTDQVVQSAGGRTIPLLRRTQAPPLSFAQQRMWVYDQLFPGQPNYNANLFIQFVVAPDVALLEQALLALVDRHEVLSTRVRHGDQGPEADVLMTRLAFERVRLSEDQSLRSCAVEAARVPFDLERDVPFRATLFEQGESSALLLSLHHFCCDEWSIPIILKELEHHYRQRSGYPSRTTLPVLPIQYGDFAAWQRRNQTSDASTRAQTYWLAQLEDVPHALELPLDRPRGARQVFAGSQVRLPFPRDVGQGVTRFARELGTTEYALLLGCYFAFLHRLTQQTDICVGIQSTERELRETEDLVGCFLNTLVIRSQVSSQLATSTHLRDVHRLLADARAHQSVSFESLLDLLELPRDLGVTPLFQTLFIMRDEPTRSIDWLDQSATSEVLDLGVVKYDLSVSIDRLSDGLEAVFEYNTALWDARTVQAWCESFVTLVGSVVAARDLKIGELDVLSSSQVQEFVVARNETKRAYPQQSLHRLFEQVVRGEPDRIALVSEDRELSYTALNERANRIAGYLASVGVLPGETVAIFQRRGFDLLASILAILKVGGVYVSLDPSFPRERLNWILEDTQPQLVLSNTSVEQTLDREVTRIDQIDLSAYSGRNHSYDGTADAVAYVMFTSGSTGRPKGVAIPHRAAVRLVTDQAYAPFSPTDVVLQTSVSSFDLSVFDVWGTLLHGAMLVLAPDPANDPEELVQLIRRRRINVALLATTRFAQLVEHDATAFAALERLYVCGEALPPASVLAVQQAASTAPTIVNVYGPTENGVFSTAYEVPTLNAEALLPVPIGVPISNCTVYLLDEAGNSTIPGAVGEVYAGGDGVGVGYVNREAETQRLFVPNPFGSGRLYRTGDLCRWGGDGQLHFVGRADQQVKVRGFRVELGEIETQLRRVSGIQSCAVALKQAADWLEPGLVAYYVPESNTPVAVHDLRNQLAATLPSYMLPQHFVAMEQLPVGPTGKLNRQVLPEPDFGRGGFAEDPTAPTTPTEASLCDMWQSLLNIPSVGIHDDFFELGGQSLIGVRLMRAIEVQFGINLPLTLLFERGTVAGLAKVIDGELAVPRFSPLVQLKAGRAASGVFFVHAVDGYVHGFEEFARHFSDDCPVYGLQAFGLQSDQPPFDDLESMGAAYASVIREAQPEGPYFVGGISMGGLVAFEVARQLEAMGAEVGQVFVGDTYFVQGPHVDEADVRAALAQPFWQLGGPMTWINLAATRLHRLLRHFKRAKRIRDQSIALPPETLLKAHNRATHAYRPQRIRAPITLIRSSQVERAWLALERYFGSDKLGWDRLTSGIVTVAIQPGSHDTICYEHNAERFAHIVEASMAETLRG